jgi:SPOR domain
MKIALSILLLFPLAAFSQVEIVKDHRLDLLIAKQEELNKKVYLENNRTTSGFRILVVNTNDRQKAMDVKSTLMRDFPDHKCYLIYQSPHFKVQIGNFRKREEADQLRKQVMKLYPTGVIVIPSTIEVKPEEIMN